MEGVKKYAQILADMEHKIASGHYRAGQRVPSVREAAQQYGVSPGTIVKAYAELETRHAIYSIPQSGYYVVDQAGGEKRGGEHGVMDFSSSSPDAGLFPHQDFQHCLNKAFEIYGRATVQLRGLGGDGQSQADARIPSGRQPGVRQGGTHHADRGNPACAWHIDADAVPERQDGNIGGTTEL